MSPAFALIFEALFPDILALATKLLGQAAEHIAAGNHDTGHAVAGVAVGMLQATLAAAAPAITAAVLKTPSGQGAAIVPPKA